MPVSATDIESILVGGGAEEGSAEEGKEAVEEKVEEKDKEEVKEAPKEAPKEGEGEQKEGVEDKEGKEGAEEEGKKEEKPEEPEGDFDTESKPDLVKDKDGKKMWFYTETRGRTLVDGYHRGRQYDEICNSPEEAKEHAEAHLALEEMTACYSSGNAEKMRAWLGHHNEVSSGSLVIMATELMNGAPVSNPEAYGAAEKIVLTNKYEDVYRQYAEMPDKESDLAKRVLFYAQCLHYDVEGEYLPPDAVPSKDGVDRRAEEVQRREDALEQKERDRRAAEAGSWTKQTKSAIRTEVEKAADSALESIKHLSTKSPFVYKAAKRELMEAASSAVSQDGTFLQRFLLRFEQAEGTRTDEDRKSLVNTYLGKARRGINARRTVVIEQARKSVLDESASEHKQRADSEEAGRKAVSGSQAHGDQSIANPDYEKAKGSKDVQGMISALL